jgi:hypothetical protein
VIDVVVNIAQAVPRVGFTELVAEFLVQGECPLAVIEGALMLAEMGVIPADTIEGISLPDTVIGGLIQVEGLLGVVEAIRIAASLFK